MSDVDLSDVTATTIAEAPVEEAELIVIALPSRVFRSVVQALPGSAPLLSLTKGLDPETGDRLSTLVDAAGPSPCSPARTWPRRSPRACRARP